MYTAPLYMLPVLVLTLWFPLAPTETTDCWVKPDVPDCQFPKTVTDRRQNENCRRRCAQLWEGVFEKKGTVPTEELKETCNGSVCQKYKDECITCEVQMECEDEPKENWKPTCEGSKPSKDLAKSAPDDHWVRHIVSHNHGWCRKFCPKVFEGKPSGSERYHLCNVRYCRSFKTYCFSCTKKA